MTDIPIDVSTSPSCPVCGRYFGDTPDKNWLFERHYWIHKLEQLKNDG